MPALAPLTVGFLNTNGKCYDVMEYNMGCFEPCGQQTQKLSQNNSITKLAHNVLVTLKLLFFTSSCPTA